MQSQTVRWVVWLSDGQNPPRLQLNLAIPDGQNLAPVVRFNIGSGKANLQCCAGNHNHNIIEGAEQGESRESLRFIRSEEMIIVSKILPTDQSITLSTHLSVYLPAMPNMKRAFSMREKYEICLKCKNQLPVGFC